MSQKFRWGIIGPGRIARQFAEDVQVTEDSEIAAVASRSGDSEFVNTYQVPKVFDSYQSLVEDPEVDAVYIATPHRFHYENARLCLEAGKPVLCEKPLTVNAPQAQELIDLSHQRGVFLMEALWSRYLPIYGRVRQWLDSGAIGRIVAIQSSFNVKLSRDPEDRWMNPELAGGTLLDLGIYPIAVSQWVLQENPVDVRALGVLGSTGVDISLTAIMKYPGEVISRFITSMEYESENPMVISGTEGSIRLHSRFHETSSATLMIDGKETTAQEPFRSRGFEYEIEEAVRCIREGSLESPDMTHADSLANLKVMDSIRAQIGLKYPFEQF
ncbi:MAG: Gfo/Idh/MocA family oxidoreductase [Anaerolineales bacterium]|jgi:predicted dehydrogenase